MLTTILHLCANSRSPGKNVSHSVLHIVSAFTPSVWNHSSHNTYATTYAYFSLKVSNYALCFYKQVVQEIIPEIDTSLATCSLVLWLQIRYDFCRLVGTQHSQLHYSISVITVYINYWLVVFKSVYYELQALVLWL